MALDTTGTVTGRQKTAPAPKPPRGPRWLPLLASAPLALLAFAAWHGRHVRPSADEWCFLPHVRDEGVFGLVDKFWSLDNGRLGNGLLVGLYAQFPVAGHQWYALISGALMLGLLWALTVALLRRARLEVPRGMPLLVAGTVTVVFLFATPNTYKTFYWPAASVSHTLAPVLCAAAAIPLLRARGRAGRIGALVVAGCAGVFMGTLSEEASVVSLVVLATTVLFAPLLFTPRARRFLRLWSLTAMAGIAAGTLLLYTSPGSRTRRERFGAESVSMFAPDSLGGAFAGFLEILGRVLTTWEYLGAVAVGVLLGLLARTDGARGRILERARTNGARGQVLGPACTDTARGPVLLPARPALLLPLGAAAFLVAGYLCTVITYPVFGERVVTAERTWNDYLLLFVLLLVATGAALGRTLRPHRPSLTPALAATLCTAALIGLTVSLTGLAGHMQTRADLWDAQDERLRQGAARGETALPYTPTPVSYMLEPFREQGRKPWPAQCVADYYRLDSVTYAPTAP